MATEVGIDLGTANVLVYIKGKGIVLEEPSVVALNQDTDEILAVGEEARQMLGRTPGNIVAVKPLRDGVVSDYDITEKMLKYFIRKVCGSGRFFKPRIMVCVPSGVTEVEKRAVREAATQAGGKSVFLIEEPVAAAIGAGLDIAKPDGVMVIDIGGGTTDVAVIALGGIVTSESIKVAGDKFDEAIENYIQMKIPVLWIDDLDIPMVEDKSADMVFSRRPAKLTTSDRRGGRRPSRGSSEHERRRPAPRTEKRRDEEVDKLPKRRSNADYSKLSRMSVEERMKLYRKEYEKEGGAKRSQERKRQSKRPVKPMAQISSAPNQMSITPKKKSNLWSRFKALFGKKEEK